MSYCVSRTVLRMRLTMCVCRVLRCVSLTLPQHQVNIRMAQCLCLHVTPQVTGWPLQHDSDYVCTSCMLLTDDGPYRDAPEKPCCISDISTATDGGCRFAGEPAYWIWQIRMYSMP